MKATFRGKRYDSDKMETIGERDHYSHSNHYAGTAYLKRASDGTYWTHMDSNGQSCHVTDGLWPCENVVEEIEMVELTDEQEKRAVELKLLEIVP